MRESVVQELLQSARKVWNMGYYDLFFELKDIIEKLEEGEEEEEDVTLI